MAPPPAPPESVPAVPPLPSSPFYDCNENGVEDAIDIALGTCSDANHNAIPDECEGGALPISSALTTSGPGRGILPLDVR
jgi:hypothetical protein